MPKLARDGLAQREVDPTGPVDEEAQRAGARMIERDELDLGIELPQPRLNCLFEVSLAHKKRWARAHLSRVRVRMERSEYSREIRPQRRPIRPPGGGSRGRR